MNLNQKMFSKVAFLVSAMFLVGVVWARAQSGPPDTISYQGYLTDSAGDPVDATLDIQVEFFDVSTGGAAVYTETHSGVTVSQGQFNLDLGSGTTSGTWASDVDFSRALWLQITLDPAGTPETLSPRVPLSAAPYARYAFSIADNAVTPAKLNGISGNGSSGQVLSSDGSGGFSWADAGALSAGQGITISNNVISSTLPYPANIIWVAKSGGDFTDIQAALASISGASASNPYLVMVAPGIYTGQVVMTNYVDIQGAGEGQTIIRGTGGFAASAVAATVVGAAHAELRFVTVESDAGGSEDYAIGIYDYASLSLLHVTVTASGGNTGNYGVYNSGVSPTINSVTANASGGTNSYGVYNASASPTIINSALSGATNSIYDDASSASKVAASVVNGPVSGGAIICTDVRSADGDMLDSSCAAASAANQMLTSAADGTVSWQAGGGGGITINYYSATFSASGNLENRYVGCTVGKPVGGGCTGDPTSFFYYGDCPATGAGACATSNPTGWSFAIYDTTNSYQCYIACAQ